MTIKHSASSFEVDMLVADLAGMAPTLAGAEA
jgi:hypothetical protein